MTKNLHVLEINCKILFARYAPPASQLPFHHKKEKIDVKNEKKNSEKSDVNPAIQVEISTKPTPINKHLLKNNY